MTQEDQLRKLEQFARYNPGHKLSPYAQELLLTQESLDEDPGFSILSTLGQFGSGFVQGMSTLRFGDDPQGWWEELARGVGSMAGFIGVVPGVGTVGSAVTRTASRGLKAMGVLPKLSDDVVGVGKFVADRAEGFRSIPLLAGDLVAKYAKEGMHEMASKQLMGKFLTRKNIDLLEGGVRMGTAFASMSWQDGADQMMKSFLLGGFFGTGDRFLANLPALKDHKVARAITASVFNGLPSTAMGQPLELQVFDYLLGAYFGLETPYAQRAAMEVVQNSTKDMSRFEFYSRFRHGDGPKKIRDEFGEDADQIISEIDGMAANEFGRMLIDEEGNPYSSVAHIVAKTVLAPAIGKRAVEYEKKGYSQEEAIEMATGDILGSNQAVKVMEAAVKTDEQYMDQALGEIDPLEKFEQFSRDLGATLGDLKEIQEGAKDIGGDVTDREAYIEQFEQEVSAVLNPTKLELMPDKVNEFDAVSNFQEPEDTLMWSITDRLYPDQPYDVKLAAFNELSEMASNSVSKGESFMEFMDVLYNEKPEIVKDGQVQELSRMWHYAKSQKPVEQASARFEVGDDFQLKVEIQDTPDFNSVGKDLRVKKAPSFFENGVASLVGQDVKEPPMLVIRTGGDGEELFDYLVNSIPVGKGEAPSISEIQGAMMGIQTAMFDKGYVMAPMTKAGGAMNFMRVEVADGSNYIDQMRKMSPEALSAGKSGRNLFEDYQQQRDEYIEQGRGIASEEKLGEIFDKTFEANMRMQLEVVQKMGLKEWIELTKGGVVGNAMAATKRMQLAMTEGMVFSPLDFKDVLVDPSGARSIIVSAGNKDGSHKAFFEVQNPDGTVRRVAAGEDAFEHLNADGSVKKRRSDATRDGLDVVRQNIFTRMAVVQGQNPREIGQLKNVAMFADSNGGFMSKRSMKVSDSYQEAIMDQYGLDMIYFDTSVKNSGKRPVLDYVDVKKLDGSIQREFYDRATGEQVTDLSPYKFATPVDGVTMNFSTTESASSSLKPQTLAMQLTRNPDPRFFSGAVMDNIFEENYMSVVRGDEATNASFEQYRNLEREIALDPDISAIAKGKKVDKEKAYNAARRMRDVEYFVRHLDVSKLGAEQVRSILSEKAGSNYTLLYDKVFREVAGSKENFDPSDLDYFEPASNKEVSAAERILQEVKVITPSMVMGNKILRKHIETRLDSYMKNRLQKPKVDYSMKAVGVHSDGHHELIYGRIERGEFMLGSGAKQMKVKSTALGEDTTLGKLWDEYQNIKSKQKLTTKDKKFLKNAEDDMEMIVARVPMDSVSGARVLRFKGFREEAGHGVALNHMDMSYLGGMDLDFDTAFIYQNIGKTKVKDAKGKDTSFIRELKNVEDQWERTYDPQTGRKAYLEQKGEASKRFFQVEDMPENWSGEATTFSPLPLATVGYNTWTGKNAVGYAANAGQHNRSLAFHIWNTKQGGPDHMNKGQKNEYIKIGAEKIDGQGWRDIKMMKPTRGNTWDFSYMSREGINWAADSSDYYSAMPQSQIKSSLAQLILAPESRFAEKFKIASNSEYRKHAAQMGIVTNKMGGKRLGSFEDMARAAALLPEINAPTVKDRTFNLIRKMGLDLGENIEATLGVEDYKMLYKQLDNEYRAASKNAKNFVGAAIGYRPGSFGTKSFGGIDSAIADYNNARDAVKENIADFDRKYKERVSKSSLETNIQRMAKARQKVMDFVANDMDDAATATLLLSRFKRMSKPFLDDPKAMETLSESLVMVGLKADAIREEVARVKYASKHPSDVTIGRSLDEIRAEIKHFKDQLPAPLAEFFEIRLLGSKKKNQMADESKLEYNRRNAEIAKIPDPEAKQKALDELKDQYEGSGILTEFYAMPEISGKTINSYLTAIDQILTGTYKAASQKAGFVESSVIREAMLPSDPTYTRLSANKQSGSDEFDNPYGRIKDIEDAIDQVRGMLVKNAQRIGQISTKGATVDDYSAKEITNAKKRAKELRDVDVGQSKEARKIQMEHEREKVKFLSTLDKDLVRYAKGETPTVDDIARSYITRVERLIYDHPNVAKEFMDVWRGVQTNQKGFFTPLRQASIADLEMFLRNFEKKNHFLSRFSKTDVKDGVSFHHWMVFPETVTMELMQHDMKFRKMEAYGVGENGQPIRTEVRIPTSTHGQIHNVVDTMIGARDNDVNYMNSWLERQVDAVRQVNLSSKGTDGDTIWEMAVRQRELSNQYGDAELYKKYYDVAKAGFDKIASKTYMVDGKEVTAQKILDQFVSTQTKVSEVLWKKYYEGTNTEALVVKSGKGTKFERYDIESTLKNIFAQVRTADRKAVPMIGINNINRLVFQRKVENITVNVDGNQVRIGDLKGDQADKAYKDAVVKLEKMKMGPDIVNSWDMNSYFPHNGWPKAHMDMLSIQSAARKVAFGDEAMIAKLVENANDPSIPKSIRNDFKKEFNNAKYHQERQLGLTEGFREDGESLFVEDATISMDALEDAGMYFKPVQSRARGEEFTIPGWIVSPSAFNTYIESAARTYFNKAMALTGDNLIRKFEKSSTGLTAEGQKAWGQFMRLFLRDNLGYTSTLPKAYMDNPALGVKKSPYYWFSDENVVSKYRSISEKLGSPTKLGDEEIAQKFKWLSNAEAKWQLTSLLSRPKTYLNNVVGGGVFNWIENGGTMMRNAQSISYLRQNVNPSWKTMDDAYEFAESHGALESWLKVELNIAGSSNKAAYSKGVQAVLDVIKKKPLIDDRTLLEELDRLGVSSDIIDKAAFFMKKSERLLRYNAFMSSYLKAREIFEANGIKTDINDPWMIEFAKRGVKATQFIYNNANRPAFSRTNIGRVFSRFQLWAWNSTRFMRDTYSQAADMGFKKGTPEMERYKRMVIANAFMMALAGAFAYSIFDVTLPQPLAWIKSMGEWAFGTESQSDKAFMGPLPGPMNIVAPPSIRALDAGLAFAVDGVTPNFFSSKVWTMLPFGALTRDLYRTASDPGRAPEYMLGIPWSRMISE